MTVCQFLKKQIWYQIASELFSADTPLHHTYFLGIPWKNVFLLGSAWRNKQLKVPYIDIYIGPMSMSTFNCFYVVWETPFLKSPWAFWSLLWFVLIKSVKITVHHCIGRSRGFHLKPYSHRMKAKNAQQYQIFIHCLHRQLLYITCIFHRNKKQKPLFSIH